MTWWGAFASFVSAQELPFLVLDDLCEFDVQVALYDCSDSVYSSWAIKLDRALDPFLDDFVAHRADVYQGDADKIVWKLDSLRQRVASFSTQNYEESFLFVVEYVYYKISWMMDAVIQASS